MYLVLVPICNFTVTPAMNYSSIFVKKLFFDFHQDITITTNIYVEETCQTSALTEIILFTANLKFFIKLALDRKKLAIPDIEYQLNCKINIT